MVHGVKDAAKDGAQGAEHPRRKRLQSDERRQEFIEAAIEFFAEEGFESSTRRLARRLGVTQPLLYRYFPSKEDLIGEVYEVVYVNRWRDEWADLLRDRSRPLRDRLLEFYTAYTGVIFNHDWMRIFLFSGLKGVDINRRYLRLVRSRILEPIVVESRAEAALADLAPTRAEVEFVWIMHGGIFYHGVRKVIYEELDAGDTPTIIRMGVDAMLGQIGAVRNGGGGAGSPG
jgi:AcrR family transcriptional regulator